MAQQQQAVQPRTEGGAAQSTQAAPAQQSLRPAVDIFETKDGLTLVADMPGVAKDGLALHVDGDTLEISGEAVIDLPQDMRPLFAEVRATRYRRSFTLSKELDAERIGAKLKDGVLTLTIPKRAELQPRKIQVNVN